MFAAQSVVAPIGAVTLVSNIMFATFFLGETLNQRDLTGSFFILAGSLTCVLSGDHEEKNYTVQELGSFYTDTGFQVYFVILTTIMLSLYGGIKYINPYRRRYEKAIKEYDKAIAAVNNGRDGVAALAKADDELAKREQEYDPFSKIHPFCYCTLSGFFGGQNILFGKMVAELTAKTIGGDNQLKYLVTYLYIFLMFGAIITQLHFLACGLELFDALYVVPIFQCFLIVVSTVGGAAYFKEFNSFSATQIIMFPAGMVALLIGVYIMSTREMGQHMKRDRSRSSSEALASAVELNMKRQDTKEQSFHDPDQEHSVSRSLSENTKTSLYARGQTVELARVKGSTSSTQDNKKAMEGIRGTLLVENLQILAGKSPDEIDLVNDLGANYELPRLLHTGIHKDHHNLADEDEGPPSKRSSYSGKSLSNIDNPRIFTEDDTPPSPIPRTSEKTQTSPEQLVLEINYGDTNYTVDKEKRGSVESVSLSNEQSTNTSHNTYVDTTGKDYSLPKPVSDDQNSRKSPNVQPIGTPEGPISQIGL